jgi:hypothetical protein
MSALLAFAPPGVAATRLPGMLQGLNGADFPLVLTAGHGLTHEDMLQWLTSSRPQIEAALLEHSGAVFFRGFPVQSAECFDAFMQALGVPPKPYVGGAAVRHVVFGDVFTSNESPPSEVIPFQCVASPGARCPPLS